jgi:uncharacterized protein YjbI with pentapeptide repeats
MANPEQLATLKLGVEAWNRWRLEYPHVASDLRGAELGGAKLARANLDGTCLNGAYLGDADLRGSNLSGAKLKSADLWRANLRHADLRHADLTSANLALADLSGANLQGGRLDGANLHEADLLQSDLSNADLIGANLSGANIIGARLSGASLRRASLVHVRLTGTVLVNANVAGAQFGGTVLADCDLRAVAGLESVEHLGPSHVSIDIIYRSEGKIPEAFLLGCGLPESFIAQIPALVGALKPIQFYSCFISYSTKDEAFAKRLHERMRAEKLRVWFSPEDVKGGEKLHAQIERAIQLHDRLLLVLSENSIESPWVVTEIRNARRAEIREKRRKLFPIRLCDFETLRHWECFDADFGADLANEIRQYFIPDFSNWKNHDDFEGAFARLLKDLRPSES